MPSRKFLIVILFFLLLVGCNNEKLNNQNINIAGVNTQESLVESNAQLINQTGVIYLYGERHGDENMYNKELEIWSNYYHNQNMRHLFIETSYFTAEYLNIWMHEDNDNILDELFNDWKGTQSHSEFTYNFFKSIKSDFPETIFHGTDVGHQHHSTGKRFKAYLIENDLENSMMYELTLESIDQGIKFYKNQDHAFRENTMAENIIREFNQLDNQDVMGIYGGAHIEFDSMDHYGLVPNMATQLKDIYHERIVSVNLTKLPLRKESITVNNKTYNALYFGKLNLDEFPEYKYSEYWRLENAYEDFKDYTAWDVLPYSNYPMDIEDGQVFVIDIMKTDGTKSRLFYRSDGLVWNGLTSTVGLSLYDIPKVDEPVSKETVFIGQNEYEADYYGVIDFKAFSISESLEYWKVPDAYEDYENVEIGDFKFKQGNYPFDIEEGNIYIVKINMSDDTSILLHMICNGKTSNDELITYQINIE